MYEYFGVILSIAGVWLATQRSLWHGPFSIAACILYGWVFFKARLYADSILQIFFLFIAIYGWYAWVMQYIRQKNHTHAPALIVVRPLTQSAFLVGLCITITGTVLWGRGLQYFTDDPSPFLDAGLSSASIVSALWTAKRYRANWLLWILIDTVYSGLFFDRGLYPTMGLYTGFALISLYGYVTWQDEHHHEEKREKAKT